MLRLKTDEQCLFKNEATKGEEQAANEMCEAPAEMLQVKRLAVLFRVMNPAPKRGRIRGRVDHSSRGCPRRQSAGLLAETTNTTLVLCRCGWSL